MKHTLSYRNVLIIFCLGLLTMPATARAQITNLIVDRADDPNPATASTCLDAVPNDCSLRGAINHANGDAATTYAIFFDPSLNGIPISLSRTGTNEDVNATGDLDILVDLDIMGNGARQTIISAANIDRVFHIINAQVSLQDITVQDGTLSGLNQWGAGIFNDGPNLFINRSSVKNNNNQDDAGGGVFNQNGTTTIYQSEISNNNAQIFGGGIVNASNGSSSATLTMANSTISTNQSGNLGGGIVSYANAGLGSGNSTVTIINSTVTNNQSGNVSGIPDGGGLVSVDAGGSTAVITLQNSIVAGNMDPADTAGDCFTSGAGAAINSAGHNLTGLNTGCPTGATGDVTTGTPNNDINPILANNGGLTDSHDLVTGSQAIDTGNDTICGDVIINNADQRGAIRPFDGNGDSIVQCDIGAVEFSSIIPTPPVLVVDRADDPDPATASACIDGIPNDCSLRGAINRANADLSTANTVLFDPILDGTVITLSIAGTLEDANATGDLDITFPATITGNGARQTIISANNLDRSFHIVGNINVTIQDVTIQDGNVSNFGQVGGGVLNDSGDFNLNRSTVQNNQAQDDLGGGLANRNGTMTISQSTITNNSSQLAGGGIYNHAQFNDATLTIVNSTLAGNQAGILGGAIVNSDEPAETTNAATSIINSTIAWNQAGSLGGDGGGVSTHLFGSGTAVVTFQNSIITGNTSANIGSGDCFVDVGASIVSNGNNLTTLGEGCPTIGSDLTNNNPFGEIEAALADNGGPTDTLNLQASGQALDAGNGIVCSGTAVNNLDQRGVTRPLDGDGDNIAVCDIGAVEAGIEVEPTIDGGDGPGGVGITDGSTPLSLWLNAGTGITISGSGVSDWEDQSGHGNHATQTNDTNRPANPTGIVNSQPTVQFNGNSHLLNLPDFASSYTEGEVFIAIQVANDPIPDAATGGLWDFGLENTNMTRYPWTDGIIYDEWGTTSRKTTINPSTPLTQFNIYNVTSIPAEWTNRLNGTQLFTTNTNTVGFQTAPVIGYSSSGSGGHLEGHLPEMIIYNTGLPLVERILVENYLSALYAIDISASGHDVYDGDGNNSGNGDFDLNVAGIGRINGNSHTQSHSVGLIVRSATFLQEDGDWLLFGHRTLQNDNTISDLPVGGDWDNVNDQRWARHWYMDVTDNGSNGGTVDIIFDFSEGGMDGTPLLLPSPPASNYRLLRRTGETGDFEDITAISGATVNVVGDQVQFLGVNVNELGSNFTLGTLDFADSPTAVTLKSINTADQNVVEVILAAAVIMIITAGSLWLKRKVTYQTPNYNRINFPALFICFCLCFFQNSLK